MGHFGFYMPTCSFHRAESLPGRDELGCNNLQHTHMVKKTPPLSGMVSHEHTKTRAGEVVVPHHQEEGWYLVAPNCTMPLVPHRAALYSSKILLEMWDVSLLPSHPHTINKASHGWDPLRFWSGRVMWNMFLLWLLARNLFNAQCQKILWIKTIDHWDNNCI